MEIKSYKPHRGNDAYRIDDSDDFVVMENLGSIPYGKFRLENHGILFICTEGRAQLEYDGTVIQLQKNDMFLYMRNSIISNLMVSSNCNGRLIFFSRGELWNINLYSKASLADIAYLKQHPKVHLTDDEVTLLDSYFQLLYRRTKHQSSLLKSDILRSLASTIMLEMLTMLRHNEELNNELDLNENNSPRLHRRHLANKFILIVEQSDGRIRKVDKFASQLNITPKYLSTILKETIDRRPSDIIQLFTMKAIERRLRFTDMTMQEISNDLLFPNASFFGKYVKQHTGMTPLEYRMKYQREK